MGRGIIISRLRVQLCTTVRRWGFMLGVLLLLPWHAPAIEPVDFFTQKDPSVLAEELLSRMSDEEILAQVFMFGWVGADPSPLILEWIEKRRIGGVKIFGWNTEDTLRLARAVGTLQEGALRAPLKIPLLVATDQEGGWIRHVKGITSESPGNMAIGASGFPQDAYQAGFYIGRELAALGINMNFAPTVDLYTNTRSVLIGPRSFGDNPSTAGILGAAFARGMEKAGVIPTAKHFPGHGDTELDSHGILPLITIPFETLWNRELLPYRILVKEKIPAIMSGHLAFPLTKAGRTPASLSPYFITEILRGKMGFTGIVVTDDLMMNGATTPAGSLSRAAQLALEAGNDILMFSKTPFLTDPVWTNLLATMQQNPQFRRRVQDAARRVLELKLTYLRRPETPPFVPKEAEVRKRVPDKEGQAFFLQLAARSVTVIFNKNGVIPVKKEQASRVLFASPFEDFLSQGRKLFPGVRTWRFSYDAPERLEIEQQNLRLQAQQVDTVVITCANGYGANLIEALRASGKRVIVVSVLSPIYVERLPWVDGALAIYSYAPESFLVALSTLAGTIQPEGKLPFKGLKLTS